MEGLKHILKVFRKDSRRISHDFSACLSTFTIYINIQLLRYVLSGEPIQAGTRLTHGPSYLALYYAIDIASVAMNQVADSRDEKEAGWIRLIVWGILIALICFGTIAIDKSVFG